MNNKNVYIGAGMVIVALLAIFFIKPDSLKTPVDTKEEVSNKNEPTAASSKNTTVSKTSGKQTVSGSVPQTKPSSSFPDIDFIDKRLSFPLKNFPGIKVTIEKIVFGRGAAVISQSCSGVPNANFSTYLYPGNGVCISETSVSGSPRGVVAIHVLLENNSDYGFGGNSDIFRLHYLRSSSSGQPIHVFANPLNDLGDYYINGYSSQSVLLSYLVPEDQLIYDLVSEYKEPAIENQTLNVYDFSVNGILIDFGSKNIKIVK